MQFKPPTLSPQGLPIDRTRLGFRISEVASSLGASKSWVHNLIRDGHLPATKICGVTIILTPDLEAFLQKWRG